MFYMTHLCDHPGFEDSFRFDEFDADVKMLVGGFAPYDASANVENAANEDTPDFVNSECREPASVVA